MRTVRIVVERMRGRFMLVIVGRPARLAQGLQPVCPASIAFGLHKTAFLAAARPHLVQAYFGDRTSTQSSPNRSRRSFFDQSQRVFSFDTVVGGPVGRESDGRIPSQSN